MRSTTLMLWAALGATPQLACGTDSAAGGVNAPCTRTSDCLDGLQCLGGACNRIDAGSAADSGQTDSSSPDASDSE